MALSTTRTLLTQTGINTHQVLNVGGLDSAGIATFLNFKTGTTNVHNIGVEAAGINVLGGDTPIGSGSTIYNDGGARFSGIVSATSFVGDITGGGTFTGDISNATGAAAGLGTALSQTQTDPLNKVYYTDKVLSISTTTTIDHPATANLAYTQYGDIKIEDGHDLIIKDGDDFKYDILGISTTKLADNYFQDGLTIGFGSSVKGNVTGNLTGNVTGNVTGDLTGNVTGNINNSTLLLQTGGAERLRISSDGNATFGTGMEPNGAVNIISSRNVETGVDDAANYHLVLKNPANDTGEAIGLAFAITDTSTKVGAAIVHERDAAGSQGSMKFFTRPDNAGPPVQRMTLTDDGKFLFIKTSFDQQAKGMSIENHARVMFTNDNIIAFFTRTGSDGQMIRFYGDTTSEGSINISGTSISYNGGVLSRWSQIVGISTNNKADRPTIYKGTVMSNLDEMCDWGDEENMQLNKTQVSNVSGDKNVAGVFWAWDDDDDTYLNDYYVAQTGDYIIRVGAATTITRGDLLESAGDGTAKPQSDDIVRSKTVAKVTSGIAHTTYPDGTKTYPCVLMAS